MAEASWTADGIVGWGSYVFKEKIKRLKETLKAWNRDHFSNLDSIIKSVREKIHSLDEKDDAGALLEEGVLRRKEATT